MASWLPSIWEPWLRRRQSGRAERALAVAVTGGDGSSSCLSPVLPRACQPKPEDGGSSKGVVTAAESVASRELLFTLSFTHTNPSAQRQRVLQLMCDWQRRRLTEWEMLHKTGWRREGLVAAVLSRGDAAALGATGWAALGWKESWARAAGWGAADPLGAARDRTALSKSLQKSRRTCIRTCLPTVMGQDRLAGIPNTQPGRVGRVFLNAQGTHFLPFLSCLDMPLSKPSHPVPVASRPEPPHLPGPRRRTGRLYRTTVREAAAFYTVICQHYGFSTAGKISGVMLPVTPCGTSAWAARSAPPWAWQSS